MQFNHIYLLNILGREVLNLREKWCIDFYLTVQYIAKDIAFHGKLTQGHQQVPLSANLMLGSFSVSGTFLAVFWFINSNSMHVSSNSPFPNQTALQVINIFTWFFKSVLNVECSFQVLQISLCLILRKHFKLCQQNWASLKTVWNSIPLLACQ